MNPDQRPSGTLVCHNAAQTPSPGPTSEPRSLVQTGQGLSRLRPTGLTALPAARGSRRCDLVPGALALTVAEGCRATPARKLVRSLFRAARERRHTPLAYGLSGCAPEELRKFLDRNQLVTASSDSRGRQDLVEPATSASRTSGGRFARCWQQTTYDIAKLCLPPILPRLSPSGDDSGQLWPR